MTKAEKIEVPTGLDLLRQPFAPNHIGKLPKPTPAQTKAVKEDFRKGVRCQECGQWHHPEAIHLDYVGHAALTDRLLDCDPNWNWEPQARDEYGAPKLDQNGGLWINLTVCGVTRPGYGDAQGKSGGNAVKEAIGDALRNAAMRFGAALDLWHKGELHIEEEQEGQSQGSDQGAVSPPAHWREPESQYNCKTALHKGLTVHQAELTRIGNEGVFDDLENYLTSPEYQEFVKIASKHANHYLEGGAPAPEEFVGCFGLEQRARDMIALRNNQPADKEPAE